MTVWETAHKLLFPMFFNCFCIVCIVTEGQGD